jgi:hypothetical protein
MNIKIRIESNIIYIYNILHKNQNNNNSNEQQKQQKRLINN